MAGQVRSAVLRSHADATSLELRNGIWQYRRRVPSQLTQTAHAGKSASQQAAATAQAQ